ncbi:hypothetical protein M0R45_007193 [Rubus argutus]|uniref:Uncharacterized protein n=1 Tax=Rubus argutus TaxID=59490 RepID=A0AAW1YUN3_RUBAR
MMRRQHKGLAKCSRCQANTKGFSRPSKTQCSGQAKHSVVAKQKHSVVAKQNTRGPQVQLRRKHQVCKATLPLTIPRRVFKSSGKGSTTTRRSVVNCNSRRPSQLVPLRGLHHQRHVPLGAISPYSAGRQSDGGSHSVASSPDSDLEAFSHKSSAR